MSRILLIMHHIALCTPCITHFDLSSYLCKYVDHAERKTEIQAEQFQGMFGGPQASSCEDANIVVIKASPGAFNQYSLSFTSNLALCYSWLNIKLIGVVWHRSCNKINLSIYPC
jgi:hypothetical protein